MATKQTATQTPSQTESGRSEAAAGVAPWLAYGSGRASMMSGYKGNPCIDHGTLDGTTTLCGMKQISGSDHFSPFNPEGAFSCKRCVKRARALLAQGDTK